MTTLSTSNTKIVRERLQEILPWAHGHQLKGLAVFVTAILVNQTGTQAGLARALGNQEAATRQLGRLLHNDRLCPRALADAVLAYVLGRLPARGKIRLALDWTIEGDHHLLVVSLVVRGRAVPIFWRAYAFARLKGHMKIFESAVLKRVLSRLVRHISRRRVIVTADRAFADEALAEVLEAFGVAYVIRSKGITKVLFHGQWVSLQDLILSGNTHALGLGHVLYCKSNPRRLWVSLVRRKNATGTWDLWYLLSNRDWSAKQHAREYARRFGCEQGFRDAKYWLGFSKARVADTAAWARFFALFALALLFLLEIGTTLVKRAPEELARLLRRVMSRRRDHPELSLVHALLELVAQDLQLLAWLAHPSRLDLDIALPDLTGPQPRKL